MINPENYLSLVHKIARKRYEQFKHKYNYEDIFQDGCIGLIKAVNGFDKSKGVEFSTYAYPFIEGKILQSIRDDKWYMCKREDRYAANGPITLETTVFNGSGDNKEITLLETLADECNDYEISETKIIIKNILDVLPDNLKRVIHLRYYKDLTQEQIASRLKTSQASISRAEMKALNIIREKIAV